MQHIHRHRAVPNLVSRLSQRDRLELAESASLIGSAVGSVMAGLSGQILFAATPLTLALWLNTLNRHRLGEQMRLEHQGAIADLHQAVASVQTSIETLPRSERLKEVEQSLLRLSEAIAELQPVQEQPSGFSDSLNSNQIFQEFAVVRRAIVRLRDVTEANLNEIQQRLDREIQSLHQDAEFSPNRESANLARMEAQLSNLSAEFTQLQTQLETLAYQINPDSIPTQSQIEDLQKQVKKLQQQNREVVRPYLKHLTRAIEQLESKGEE